VDGGWCWANPRPFAFEATDLWSTGCEAFAVSSGGAIAHRTADGWSLMESPPLWPATSSLSGISGTASNDVWAVGPASLFHFDGQRWTDLRPASSDALMAVQALRQGVALVAGLRGLGIVSLEADGASFVTVFSEPDTNFLSVASDGRVHWAVGRYSGPSGTKSVLYKNVGRGWQLEPSPAGITLERVVTMGSHVFGIGADAFVDLTAGGSPRVELPRGSGVTTLAGTDGRNMLILSNDALRWFDGETVRSLAPVPRHTFNGAHMSGRDHFVAGRRFGRVTEAAGLVEESVGPVDDVHAVLPLPSGDVWLYGGFRSINGGRFERTSDEPLGFVVQSPLGLVSTSRGFLYQFDGTTWKRAAVPTTSAVDNVFGNPSQLWRFRSGVVSPTIEAIWFLRSDAWVPLWLSSRETVEINDIALDGAVAWISAHIGGAPRLFKVEAGLATDVALPEWSVDEGRERARFSGLCAGGGVLYGFNGRESMRYQSGVWVQLESTDPIRACVVPGGRSFDAAVLTTDGRIGISTSQRYAIRGPRLGVTALSLALSPDREHVWVGGAGGTAAFIRVW
jgi:hypothetical protein